MDVEEKEENGESDGERRKERKEEGLGKEGDGEVRTFASFLFPSFSSSPTRTTPRPNTCSCPVAGRVNSGRVIL